MTTQAPLARPFKQLSIAFLLGAISMVTHADEIRIGAGASVANQILKPIKAGFEAATGHKITINEQGPRLALESLAQGTAEGAGVILTPDEIKALFAKEGIKSDPAQLQQHQVGSTRMVVITHPSNSLGALNKEQLGAIFSGKATSWKDVGGQDQPIVIVIGKLTKGINDYYLNKFLNTGMPKDIFEASSATDVRESVAANPEAIGITTAAVPNASVKVPQQPDVASPMFLYTLGTPNAPTKALLDYVTGPGKALTK